MQTLTELLNEQANLPTQRRAAQLAGDGETLIRLADREKQLDLLIETAQTKATADRLRREIQDLEAQTADLDSAAAAKRTAAQEAMAALNDWPRLLQALQDRFAEAQRDQRFASSALDTNRHALSEKRAALRNLYQTDTAPPTPAPALGTRVAHSSVPLSDLADLPPHMLHLAGQMPESAPVPSYVVTADGIKPNDGRPVVTQRPAR